MRTCPWPRGCSATIGSDEQLCTYHGKLAAGFITTTRGESDLDVRQVDLTPAERAAAERTHSDYFARLMDAERARRTARTDEIEEAWDRALGIALIPGKTNRP